MNAISRRTKYGTPVGTAKGVVHLFSQIAGQHTYALCRRKLTGKPVDRSGDEPTCQKCIDERDMAASRGDAGFEHNVSARRVQLGYGAIGSGMRYGAEVRCYAHRDDNDHATTIWTTNEPGRMREAEEIARQHFLAAYREHLG